MNHFVNILIILIIVAMIAIYFGRNQIDEAFQYYSGCEYCSDKNGVDCMNCDNCTWEVGADGIGRCVSRSSYFWNYPTRDYSWGFPYINSSYAYPDDYYYNYYYPIYRYGSLVGDGYYGRGHEGRSSGSGGRGSGGRGSGSGGHGHGSGGHGSGSGGHGSGGHSGGHR